jgi:transposase InsO family protein
MDLFGPSRIMSVDGNNYYALVIVDDYSRFTWTLFLSKKSNAFQDFKRFSKRIENEKNCKIGYIRSDHGGEFTSHVFEMFCEEKDISHNFSTPRTPQQNGVVEKIDPWKSWQGHYSTILSFLSNVGQMRLTPLAMC